MKICNKTNKPCQGPVVRPPYQTEFVNCACVFMQSKSINFDSGKSLIISGGQASGKTTLARDIARAVGNGEAYQLFSRLSGKETFKRNIVIVEECSFPSDLYLAKSVSAYHGGIKFIFITNDKVNQTPAVREAFMYLDLDREPRHVS